MDIENQKEILPKKWEEIFLAIKESEKEQEKLRSEIKENEKEIWWYKIRNEYSSFLTPDEKWFAIILSDEEEGGDTNLWIIVKYEEWKTTIRDTQQEPFWDEEYNKIKLNKDEQIEWNDDVNKINKLIKSRWLQTIKGDELKKLELKVEWLKKENGLEYMKIWWHTFEINKEKKEFSIEINETHIVTVKFIDWEFIFNENHEWDISWTNVDNFSLEENETLKWNEKVNTLNKLIKFYSWHDNEEWKWAIDNEEDLQKLAKLFEMIRE